MVMVINICSKACVDITSGYNASYSLGSYLHFYCLNHVGQTTKFFLLLWQYIGKSLLLDYSLQKEKFIDPGESS